MEQTVGTPEGQRLSFTYDAFWKEAILQGKTELDITLSLNEEIAGFEIEHRRRMEWLCSAVSHDDGQLPRYGSFAFPHTWPDRI